MPQLKVLNEIKIIYIIYKIILLASDISSNRGDISFIRIIDIISSYRLTLYIKRFSSRPKENLLKVLRPQNPIAFNKITLVLLESKFCFNNSLETI